MNRTTSEQRRGLGLRVVRQHPCISFIWLFICATFCRHAACSPQKSNKSNVSSAREVAVWKELCSRRTFAERPAWGTRLMHFLGHKHYKQSDTAAIETRARQADTRNRSSTINNSNNIKARMRNKSLPCAIQDCLNTHNTRGAVLSSEWDSMYWTFSWLLIYIPSHNDTGQVPYCAWVWIGCYWQRSVPK